jgi:hypothetical protein
MKELWVVVVEKAKEVEASALLIGVGIFGLFGMWASTIVILRLIKMIITLTETILKATANTAA